MEGIHISLPVTVCRDILLSQQQNLYYEASISTGAGNSVKKTKGSISAHLVSGPNGDKLIDIVVQFPARTKSLNIVKGKLYCQVEEVREKQNTPSVLDAAVRLQCQSEVAHETPLCNNNATKAPENISPAKERKKKVFEEAPQHVHEGRPPRHREKPTKFKDYDTELDFIRRETPRQTLLSDDEKEIEAEEPNAPRSEGELSKTDCKITSDESNKRDKKRCYVRSKTFGNQKRRTYDKLIKHLTQATEQEGSEIQSVLFSLKSSVYKDQKVSKGLLISEQRPKDTSNGHCVSNGIKLDRPFQITGHESSQNGEPTEEAVSKQTVLSSLKSGVITKKWGKTFPPQLKSFPRKFPSSLRSSTSCLLQDSLDTGQTASQKSQPVDKALTKYRIISPSLAVFEDAHTLHNTDSDPDYDPDNFGDDLDGEKKKAKRKKHLVHSRKTKVLQEAVSSSEADSDRLLDKFQVLHASTVKQGDQFFIPQNTSVREGKMNTMLIGPFRLVGSSEESRIEIVPEHERAATLNVLYGDLHLPNATVWGLEGTGTKVIMHTLSTAALSATHDHDYIKGRHNASDIPKVPRTFLKPIRMAQHISARVEKVEEGEGKSLVTISGHNNKAKSDAGILTFTPRINAEGIPIADCLEDVMTDTIRRVEKDRESYQKALEAKPTEPEVVGVNDMPVAGEVVLKVWGQVPNNKRGIRRNWIRGRPRKHLPLAAILQQGVTKTNVDGTGTDKKNITVTLQNAGSNVVVTMQGEVSLPSTDDLGEESLYVSSGLEHEENVAQGIVGANFKPGEIIVIGNDEGKNTLFTDSEVKLDTTSNVNVLQKSDKGLLSSSHAKIPKMCNYCLRLFPGPVLLYRHVKNDHSMYFKDAGYQQYLEDLRLDKLFVCPFCPGRHSLSNEYRFRAHLTQVHKVEIQEQSNGWKSTALSSLECEICHVYFQSWGELEVHATCVHDSHLLSCPHCPDAFILENTLCQHLKMHNTKKTQITAEEEQGKKRGAKKCRFSGLSRGSINRPKRLKRGMANGSIDRTQQSCSQCGKLFKTAGSLARHVETRHSSIEEGETQMSAEKLFQCACCLEQFTSLWEVQEHQQHVHTSATLHCLFCGEGCTSVSSMYTHISECHLLTEMLACPVCQDQFLSQKALAQHIYSIHHLEFGGSLEFAVKQNLDEVSDGERTDDCMQNFQCPYCTDIFTQTSLVAHIVEDHREQFPHSCPHCEQTFLTKEVLQHHMQFAHDYNSPFQSLLSPQSPKKQTMAVTLIKNQVTGQQGVTGILKSCHSASDAKPGIPENFVYSVGKQDIQALLTGETEGNVQQVTIYPETAYQLSSHFSNSNIEQNCDVEYLEIVTDDSITIATDVITEGESAVENIVYGMQLSADITDESV